MNGIKRQNTFPGCSNQEDATAFSVGPGKGYLRLYRHPGVPNGLPAWFWVARDGHAGAAYGQKTTAKEAVRAAEGAWAKIAEAGGATAYTSSTEVVALIVACTC